MYQMYSLRGTRLSNVVRVVLGKGRKRQELLSTRASSVRLGCRFPQRLTPYITQEPATQATKCKTTAQSHRFAT